MSDLPPPGSYEEHLLNLQHDPAYFVLWVFSVLEPDKDLKVEPYLLAILQSLRPVLEGQPARLIINAPPRTLKSIIVSVALPAFLLGSRPGMKIIVFSYAEDLAVTLHLQFQTIVQHPDFQAAFPDLAGARTDRNDRFITRHGGFRMALSVGGAGTGFGADLIIIDDPLKGSDAGSQLKRDEVFNWYRQVVASRSNTPASSQIIIVTQRLHADDLCGRLLEQEGWTHLSLPARFSERTAIRIGQKKKHIYKEDELLSPAQLPATYLIAQQRDLGSYAYAAQYLQDPVSPGGNLVKREWVQFYEHELHWPSGEMVVSWDIGAGDGATNDYSAAVTGFIQRQTLYIVDARRYRLRFPDLVRTVKEHAEEFKVQRLLVEKAITGIALIDELQARTRFDVIPIVPRGDKISRVYGITAAIESGRVLFPREPNAEFMKELFAFPGGKHDDMVDAFSQLVQYFRSFIDVPAHVHVEENLSAWSALLGGRAGDYD